MIEGIGELLKENADKSVDKKYKEYINKINESLRSEKIFNTEFLPKVIENIENYIMYKLSFFIVPSKPTNEMKEFMKKLKSLNKDNIIKHLIMNEPMPEEFISVISDKLKQSSILRSPQQKLRCYKELYGFMKNGLNFFSKQQNICIFSKEPQLCILGLLYGEFSFIITDVNFIERFTYYLTENRNEYINNLKFAIKFIKDNKFKRVDK